MKKPIIDFKKLIYSKKFLVTISIIISVVIWFVAKMVRNPINQTVFSNVPVSVSMEESSAQKLGLGMISDISQYKFTVKISGPNYIISKLSGNDFYLSASVEEVNSPGTYSLSVTAAKNSNVSGYKVDSIEPARIDVTFDYIDTKVYPVTPKIVGVTASEGLVAETPIISNNEQSKITIKGPRDILNKIDSVISLTELPKNTVLSSSETYDSDIVLLDVNGNTLYRYEQNGIIYDGNDNKIENNLLSLSFNSLKVTQPISKKKSLEVKIKFTNMPSGLSSPGALTTSVDHSRVTVIGTPDVIDKMTKIELSSIDFRDVSLSSGGAFEVGAALPEGVKLFDNIEQFKVKINLSGFTEKTFSVSDVKYSGLDGNLSAKSAVIKNVKICGPKDVIASLKSADIYAEIDLSDKTVGEHTSDVTIKSSKYNNIWQVGKYSSSVVITDK